MLFLKSLFTLQLGCPGTGQAQHDFTQSRPSSLSRRRIDMEPNAKSAVGDTNEDYGWSGKIRCVADAAHVFTIRHHSARLGKGIRAGRNCGDCDGTKASRFRKWRIVEAACNVHFRRSRKITLGESGRHILLLPVAKFASYERLKFRLGNECASIRAASRRALRSRGLSSVTA